MCRVEVGIAKDGDRDDPIAVVVEAVGLASGLDIDNYGQNGCGETLSEYTDPTPIAQAVPNRDEIVSFSTTMGVGWVLVALIDECHVHALPVEPAVLGRHRPEDASRRVHHETRGVSLDELPQLG